MTYPIDKSIHRHTQLHTLVAYLSTNKSGITQLEAINKFGIGRLATRVFELRAMGWKIDTKTETSGKKRYARYFYAR